ncbi:TLC domain-containing protein 5 [Halyomorpha halys]|uniref:TLC domain-containing protein 5 n=1 Tax=Halyomorpha halys TaxID=286706 RepID=UPI0006D516A4|nr:transmembrane protein 136 [Halyomorpha halys]
MVLAAVYIVFCTLFAASIWHFIYRWFVHEGASSYESLMLTSVFQSMLCVACFLTFLRDNGLSTEVRDNNRLEELYIISAAGFFFHDTPHWQARHTLTSYTLLFHHLIAFVFLLATLFFGKGGSIAVQISFYMEVTTPLLAIRYYMKRLKMNCSLVELLFGVLFVTLRFWLGADIMLSILQKDEVPPPFKFGVVSIYVMSCGLLPGVIRMILSSNERPRKGKSYKASNVIQHHFVTTLFRSSSPPGSREHERTSRTRKR